MAQGIVHLFIRNRKQKTETRGQKTELVSSCGFITANRHSGLLVHPLLCPARRECGSSESRSTCELVTPQ